MANWMYYRLLHKENHDVELDCCIDLETIDDDEPDCEWMQNDGFWGNEMPDYCKIDGRDYYSELEKLKDINRIEWDFISQALVDWEDSRDEVFVREFKDAILLISYDNDFDEYYLSQKKSSIQIDGYVKRELDSFKVHERQPYNEVIKMLVKEHWDNYFDEKE